ncbi:MAG: hypothetical protein ACM3PP_12230, partial [Candidatus Saccharibacteria bacterium]
AGISMEWIILFVISWVLLFLLADWKALKTNVWCGLLAMGMQVWVDSHYIQHKLYGVHKPVIDIFGSSAFFVAGPVFVIGVLLAQFYPAKRWARIVHLIVITALFSLQEYLLVKRSVLHYINWHQMDSLGVNVAAMALLSWFSIVVLLKERKSRY